MRVIDARSGAEVAVGSRVVYPQTTHGFFNGELKLLADPPPAEGFEVLELQVGLFNGTATVRRIPGGDVVTVPLAVRYLHPSFFLRRIAFLPT